MEDGALVFYHWRFAAPDAAERRRIVNEVVAPVVGDESLRADGECVYARKYTESRGPDLAIALEPCDEVRLTVVGKSEARSRLVARITHHIPHWAVLTHQTEQREHPARWKNCALYRRGLTEVTEVVLDLHTSRRFDAHYRCLNELYAQGGLRAFTRSALHDYLLEHSPRYFALRDGRRESFWREFLRWGPEPTLFPPGHLMPNVMLVE